MLRLGHEKMLTSGNTFNYFLVIRAVTREETRRRQKMSLYLILTNVPESKKAVVIRNNVSLGKFVGHLVSTPLNNVFTLRLSPPLSFSMGHTRLQERSESRVATIFLIGEGRKKG